MMVLTQRAAGDVERLEPGESGLLSPPTDGDSENDLVLSLHDGVGCYPSLYSPGSLRYVRSLLSQLSGGADLNHSFVPLPAAECFNRE